jgi:hypothetical protein
MKTIGAKHPKCFGNSGMAGGWLKNQKIVFFCFRETKFFPPFV